MKRIIETLKEIMPGIAIAGIFLMVPILCSFLAQPTEHKLDWCEPVDTMEIDTTWVDFNTVMAHDTATFSTAEEEYQWLVKANKFKKECLDELVEASDIIEQIMFDTFDCEQKFTVDELEEILIDRGYYKHIEKFNELLETQL